VVGGGLAGARTCQELRKQGFVGPLTLLCGEDVLPYDRPPLSKAVLRGKREPKPLRIDYSGLDVDVRLGWRADSLDVDNRRVCSGDRAIPFDELVIATGSSPITVPGSGEQLVLRTAADALRLRGRMQPGAHIVVIGASWIGAEVASAAVTHGCRVTCIELANAPLAQALGTEIGSRFAPWWDGVDLRLKHSVAAVEPGGVVLDDGSFIEADSVIVGIGVRPTTAWLTGSPLELRPAVATDEFLRTAQPGILALGDAASWWSSRFGTWMDVQHWDDASAAAAVVAASILRKDDPQLTHDPVPYFWSDQFGHRLEYVGHRRGMEKVVVRGDVASGWTACWLDDRDRLTAALSVDQSKEVVGARALIAAGVKVQAADLARASFGELAVELVR
jgi:NADPH-dependent 2,4-dienoyl-CoA reductase/sulfur reductase-like enzyme